MSGSDIQQRKPSQSHTDLREAGNHNKEVITTASSESPLLPGSHRTWSLISSFEEVEGTVNFNLCFTPCLFSRLPVQSVHWKVQDTHATSTAGLKRWNLDLKEPQELSDSF